MISIARTSSFKNFLWTTLLTTAMTFTLEAVGSDGEKEDPAVIAQSTPRKLDRQTRNILRERWIPYLTSLTQKATAPNWETLEEGIDPAQLKVFMEDVDTKFRLLQGLIFTKNPQNALYAVKLLNKYGNPIELKMYFKGNLEQHCQEKFYTLWETLQKIEDLDDRSMALQSFKEWVSYTYVDRMIFNSFNLLKNEYPWLSTFSVDVKTLESIEVMASVANFGILEAHGLRGLKFTDDEHNGHILHGISGMPTFSPEYSLEEVSNLPLDQESFMRILAIIQQLNRKVTYLNLSKLRMNEDQIDKLLNAITKFKKLKYLNLNNNPFGDTGAHHLAKLFPNLKNLEYLNLNNCELTSKGVSALRNQLKRLPLYKLKISENDLGVEGIKQLAEAFTGHPYLRILELNYQKIPTLAMNSFVDFLTSTPLEVLDLEMSKIKKKAFPQFVAGLKANSALQSLEMHGVTLDQGRFIELARGLKDTNIQHLDITMCGLNEEDILALSNAIREGAPLQFLDISANKTIAKGVDIFVKSLRDSDITKLLLSDFPLDNETILKLADLIPQLPYLSDLELEQAELTDNAANSIVKAVIQHPLFARLNLNRNVFSEQTHAFIAMGLDAREKSAMNFASLEIEHNEYAYTQLQSDNFDSNGIEESGADIQLLDSFNELNDPTAASSDESDDTNSLGSPDGEEETELNENDKEGWSAF